MANQIYTLVNSVASQSLGTQAVTAVDAQSLVSLGTAVLSSTSTQEEFLNTLVKRIGKTVISSRAYRNKFADYVRDDFEWGSILQKIKVHMPDAEADESYGLTNGTAVDAMKVRKPSVAQKLYVQETPYQFAITIQRVHLKEAFTSEAAMGGFIGAITTEVRNAIELAIENLGHIALANLIGETGGTRQIKLLTEYNAINSTTLTKVQAMVDEDFLRYAIGRIKEVSKKMQYMSKVWNDGSTTRFTPIDKQRLIVLDKFETALETQVQYAAFNQEYVKLNGFQEVAYFQGEQTPDEIKLSKLASTGATKTVSNIACVLCDYDAFGMYQIDEWVASTPFNAAGGYTNTFWHERQLWFNDLSENAVVFVLA